MESGHVPLFAMNAARRRKSSLPMNSPAKSKMSPPLPIPKSNHTFLFVSTLNEGVRAVTFQGNILRWYAALEEAITQLQSSCFVTEADGIVPFAMYSVSNLLAVGYGNVGIDAPFFQVAQ